METIRNYLNAMFAGLPDTPEVRRAYEELAEMMEDKYTEMIAEGSSEQEAIGTVISDTGHRGLCQRKYCRRAEDCEHFAELWRSRAERRTAER